MRKPKNFYYTSEKKNQAPEHELQCKIKQYMDIHYPDTIFMSSMIGVYLTVGQVMKQKAKGAIVDGLPDMYIFDCRGGFGGFMVELKAARRKVKKGGAQERVLKTLHQIGYRVRIVDNLESAMAAIDDYMKLPPNPSPNSSLGIEKIDHSYWFQGLKEDLSQVKDKKQIDELIALLKGVKFEDVVDLNEEVIDLE